MISYGYLAKQYSTFYLLASAGLQPKDGGTPALGLVLGITLVSPQLMNAYNLGSQIPDVWNFGLFTIEKVGYQAQVIPSILAGLFLGWFETRLRRYIPDYLKLVIVPIVTLIISVFVAHVILGPIGRSIGNGIAEVIKLLMLGDFAPIGSAIFGFLLTNGDHRVTSHNLSDRLTDDSKLRRHPYLAYYRIIKYCPSFSGCRYHYCEP